MLNPIKSETWRAHLRGASCAALLVAGIAGCGSNSGRTDQYKGTDAGLTYVPVALADAAEKSPNAAQDGAAPDGPQGANSETGSPDRNQPGNGDGPDATPAPREAGAVDAQ